MTKSKLPKKTPGGQAENRRYIRLNAVFPVEFQFLDPQTGGSISGIKQGFTRDIGKGGICLEVNTAEEDFEKILEKKSARLDLRLHAPLSRKDTKAVASIAWHKKIKSGYPNKYIIGLSFLQIDPKEQSRIYFHARRLLLTPRIVAVFMLSLVLALGYFYLSDLKLKSENKDLVKQLVQISGKKSKLEKSILDFDSERKEIEEALSENEEEILKYQDQLKELKRLSIELKEKDELLEYFQQDRAQTKKKLKKALSEKARLSEKVTGLSKETDYFKTRITKLGKERVSAEENLKNIILSFESIEEKSISNMYKWIKNHQSKQTGLVASYEGDKDLKDWGFTYDQSLACQSFILMGDQDEAQGVLDFYKDRAKKTSGAFANAYDAQTGSVVEYDVHTGPNIWLGIAILQYARKFKDEQYLLMAEEIAEWLIVLQKEDREFGIRGGPKFNWFSTEHNLDAYAFFGMLYKITKRQKYSEAQQRTFEWLKKNAYNRSEGRLNRGKGDATIATDTFAWAIAAIGPELLNASGMDPDQIIDFAETNCLVTIYYDRPDGERLQITGFDFGKYLHLPRGGIISTEWTGQMVVTLKIMADYYKDKSKFLEEEYYKRKAEFYLSELEKMVIISPSKVGRGEGCLPYASHDKVDTGHGWRAPNGSRTGSTAGTAYTIFAKHGYNPLMLK